MNILIPRQLTVQPYRDIYVTMGLTGEDLGFHNKPVPVPPLLQVRPAQQVLLQRLRQPAQPRLRPVQLLHQRLRHRQPAQPAQRVQQAQLVQLQARQHRRVQVLVQQQRYRYA